MLKYSRVLRDAVVPPGPDHARSAYSGWQRRGAAGRHRVRAVTAESATMVRAREGGHGHRRRSRPAAGAPGRGRRTADLSGLRRAPGGPAHPGVPPALAGARRSPPSVTGWACWPPRLRRRSRSAVAPPRASRSVGDRGPDAARADPRPDRRRAGRPLGPPVHDGRLRPRPVPPVRLDPAGHADHRQRRPGGRLGRDRHVHDRDDADGLGAGQGASVPNLLPRGRLETANQLTLATTYGVTPVAAARCCSPC